MKKRSLGPFTVSAVGFGAQAFTGLYGSYTLEDARLVLETALDCGVDYFDTNDCYRGATSEASLATFLREKNKLNDTVISTKFGLVTHPAVPYTRMLTQTGQGLRVNGRPDYAAICLDRSLRQLGKEAIDLWMLNYPDPSVPIGESVAAMGEFVKKGKVRAIGVCNVTPEQAQEAIKAFPIAAIQNEFSPWKPHDAERLFPMLKAHKVAYIAWSPLAAGLFAGVRRIEPGDFRQQLPRMAGERFAQNLRIYADFPLLAEEAGITRAQLALIWELSRAPFVIPIPSTRRPSRVRQNCVSTGMEVKDEVLSRLIMLIRKAKPAGPTMFP